MKLFFLSLFNNISLYSQSIFDRQAITIKGKDTITTKYGKFYNTGFEVYCFTDSTNFPKLAADREVRNLYQNKF